MALITMSESITIDAPIEGVFTALTDVKQHLKIFTHNKTIRGYHGGTLDTNDEWETVAGMMGRDVVATWAVEELVAPHRVVYTNQVGGAAYRFEWRLDPVPGGTRVSNHARGTFEGRLGSLLASVLKRPVVRQMRGDLKRLKSILETRSAREPTAT